MGKINFLTPEIISKIAAGEVVEKPVYALKELVDNAIDAGADWIRIEIEQAGLKKIVVLDNGEGMSQEDLLKSFKMHATSKLKSDEELLSVKTLGFRGEALSSIAAISDLTIQSREHNSSSGVEVFVTSGILEKETPVGMPEGTKVVVENLFYPVPARKKFLKSIQTEWRLILEMLSGLSIAFTNIRFTLSHNKKLIFDLPKKQPVDTRIKSVMGQSFYANLLPVKFDESYINIYGFVGHPHWSMTTSSKQFLFVNNRRVADKLVSTAVKESFGSLLPGNYYPGFVLFINLPNELVDVNVHPRKEHVNFLNSQLVFDSVQKAVLETLLENKLTVDTTSPTYSLTSDITGAILKKSVTPWNLNEETDYDTQVLQLNNVYLLFKTAGGIKIYDQHAAHERILYEQFKKELLVQKKQTRRFPLKKPLTIDLSFSDSQFLQSNKIMFKKIGFDISEIAPGNFALTTVPFLFKDRDLRKLIQELIENLKNDQNFKELDQISDQIIKYLACKSAIKAGDKLSSDQAKKLIKKLSDTSNNATCPHGRPTNFFLSLEELDRQFKR